MGGVWKAEYLNFVLAPITFLLIFAYNVNLYFRFKKNPMSTVMGVNHQGRRAWVLHIMKDNDKKNILAVQTLRNSIMGSTLLATTTILSSSAVAAFLASTYNVKKSLRGSFMGTGSTGSLLIAFLCLIVGFLFAFLCYMQSVRYTNHVNFIINVPIQGKFTPHYVADVLERASNFYTIGTRILYTTIPMLLWLFGPLPFFVSTVVLIPIWYWLDTAQEYQEVASESCHGQAFLETTSESNVLSHPFVPNTC